MLQHLERGTLQTASGFAQVAGDSPSGLSVVEKAQKAVNTVKIITALNEISDILKVRSSLLLGCC